VNLDDAPLWLFGDQLGPHLHSGGYRSINALMETINGLYKAECIRTTVFHDGPYKTIADVEYATAGWVDWSTKGASTARLA